MRSLFAKTNKRAEKYENNDNNGSTLLKPTMVDKKVIFASNIQKNFSISCRSYSISFH